MFAESFLIWLLGIAAAVTARKRCGVPVWAFVVHIAGFGFRVRDASSATPNLAALWWDGWAFAAMLCFSLGACREAKLNDPTLIAGTGPVAVLQSSYVASGDSQPALGAASVTYVISNVELTNDQTAPLYPVITHFYLTDRTGNRYFGIDTGASALAGISNNLAAIKPGEKRKLVVAFRADSTTMGTIRYEY